MRATTILASVAFVALISVVGCSKEPNIHPHSVALEKQGAGDWKGAVEEWSRILKADPADTKALGSRAYCRKRLGDFSGAIEDYSAAITLSPTIGDFYAGRGDAVAALGDTARACSDINKALELGYAKAQTMKDKYCP